jgi:hypothetical protein
MLDWILGAFELGNTRNAHEMVDVLVFWPVLKVSPQDTTLTNLHYHNICI